MGNCFSKGNQLLEMNSQYIFQGEMTEQTSDGKGSKLYNLNPTKITNTKYRFRSLMIKSM